MLAGTWPRPRRGAPPQGVRRLEAARRTPNPNPHPNPHRNTQPNLNPNPCPPTASSIPPHLIPNPTSHLTQPFTPSTPASRLDEEHHLLITTWIEAKRSKNFAKADEIRIELRAMGIDPDGARANINTRNTQHVRPARTLSSEPHPPARNRTPARTAPGTRHPTHLVALRQGATLPSPRYVPLLGLRQGAAPRTPGRLALCGVRRAP